MSWILNADIILKNSNFDFKRNFIESIIIQTNHLRKNLKYEIDQQKRIEVITALILSGLAFKEYEDKQVQLSEGLKAEDYEAAIVIGWHKNNGKKIKSPEDVGINPGVYKLLQKEKAALQAEINFYLRI